MRPYTPPAIIRGSVHIQGSPCCIAGAVGQALEIWVNFSATSAAGEVIEMRQSVGGSCATATSNLANRPWRPFMDLMLFSISPPINWSTFAVAAQYRDDHGNVSAVYCDDIAVEGMPPTPTTPTPTITATPAATAMPTATLSVKAVEPE